MSGAGLHDLDWPRIGYGPGNRREFPSRETCRRHDLEGAGELIAAAELPGLICDPAEVGELAGRLADAAKAGVHLATRASAVYQGELKVKIGGAFAELIDLEQRVGTEVAFVTMCPRGGDQRPEDMARFYSRQFGARLNQALDRALARVVPKDRPRTGWSVYFLEAEYQVADDLFRFHYHGWATGDELRAIERLRKTRAYHSPNPKTGEDRDPVRHRIKRTRKPLYDLTGLCIYPLKDWRARLTPTNQAGNRDRSWPVPIPAHLMPIEWLWRDQWSLQDMSVMRGLRVINGKLTTTPQ